MTEIKCVRYCAHCGHQAPQKVVYENEYVADCDHDESEAIPTPYSWGRNFLALCETCYKFSLYAQDEYTQETRITDIGTSFRVSKLVWPSLVKLDSAAIPSSILDIYEEASKIKMLSPSSFVVQIRRALEVVCLDQGIINKRSLHAALKELAAQGKLPLLLGEVTDIIKIIGNAGAHAIGPGISQKHASVVDDFFRVLLEYLYIAPHKLDSFEEEATKFRPFTN